MEYAPHILKKKVIVVNRDEYGRITESSDYMLDICRCRCDDNNNREFRDENGRVYRPQYHIVCEGTANVNCGDEIKVFNGDTLRAEGKVYNIKTLNYLNYSEIWV